MKPLFKKYHACSARCGVSGIIAVAEARRSAGARGAFPLRLGRETVLAAGGNAFRREFFLRQLRAIGRRIGPAHAGDRTAQIAGKGAWVRVHNRQVLALGHFIFPDPKAAGEYHCGLRTFVGSPVQFVGWAAHRESVGWDEHHVRRRGVAAQRGKICVERGSLLNP